MKCKRCGIRKKANSKNGKPYHCWQYKLCGTCFAIVMLHLCKPNQIRMYNKFPLLKPMYSKLSRVNSQGKDAQFKPHMARDNK